MTSALEVRELRTDAEIQAAFPLMRELRDRVASDAFLAEVRRQQSEGYRLLAGFSGADLVCLAGVRRTHTMSRGEHLFVDDLVTTESARGQGYGGAMLQWIARDAVRAGLSRVYLDSRFTAKGFYEGLGFTFLTSIPCWRDSRE